MDLREFLRVLRRHWILITASVVLAVSASAAIVWSATPKYKATAQLFVSVRDVPSDLAGLAQGAQFTQQRMQSYAEILNSPTVTTAVAQQLQNGLTPKQIAAEISAKSPLNTVLIDVGVTDPSAPRAAAIANAASDQFALFVDGLETPNGTTTSPVKVSVVKRAAVPTVPVSPRKARDLVFGLLIGLVVGIGAAVLRDSLDTSVKNPEILHRDLSLTPLGAIAYDSAARKRPLILQPDARSARAEAFRQLRTNLQFVDIDRTPRSIVVTSTLPNEGKTTTATNLAIALRQSGTRVLLVEADLRRPKAVEYLGIEGAVGLTSVLIGQAKLSEAIQSWGKSDQLDVLPSGPIPPNPSEILGSRGMADLLGQLEADYDLVILDAPPLLPVTDAVVLSTISSGALIVVRYGYTKREQLSRAVQSMRSVDARILGAVMTMTPAKGPDAYYGASYMYYSPHTAEHAEKPAVIPVMRAGPEATNGHAPAKAPNGAARATAAAGDATPRVAARRTTHRSRE